MSPADEYRLALQQEAEELNRPAPVVPDSPDVRGLHNKYRVERWDGRDRIGEKHDGCRYFVLDLTHDEHAAVAVRAYAEATKDTRPTLSADLLAVVGQGVTAETAWDEGYAAGLRDAPRGEPGGTPNPHRAVVRSGEQQG